MNYIHYLEMFVYVSYIVYIYWDFGMIKVSIWGDYVIYLILLTIVISIGTNIT